jgi:DNA-binding response OmpR family regulator
MDEHISVLVCDDSPAVRESISAYLRAEGIACSCAADGESALEKLKNEHFDLLILDVMLPGISGTQTCREIRRTSDIPIIMLSARAEEFDRVLGLELGADDYITKPFSPREVVARIRTILKRTKPRQPSALMTVGRTTIDLDAYLVTAGGEKLELTPREVQTLACLAGSVGKVLDRDTLLNRVWGYDYCGDTRAVDTQMKRLRQKLDPDKTGIEIKSVYGIGYRLEVLE